MNSAAIIAVVQTRDVRRDHLALGRAEWRLAAQQDFMILEQRPRGLGKRPKHLQQPCLGFQRAQKTHRDMVAGALTAALGRTKSSISFFTSVVGSWQTKFSQTYAVGLLSILPTLFMNSTRSAKNC